MHRITFGFALFGTEHTREAVEVARIAEELGYERVWIGDSHMIRRELYVLAGAIAMATKRIHIGPGVTHPAVRHLTVTASAIATLNELSENRAFLGFGVGATGPGNIGMKPVSIPELEENIITLAKLFVGETVNLRGKDVHCLFPPGRVPIYIGTRATQVMKIACRLADGLIYTGETETLKAVVQRIRGYTAQANRPNTEVRFVYRLPCSLSTDACEARAKIKGIIASVAFTHLGRLYNRNELHDQEDRRALERLREHYDTYHHMGPEHQDLIRDEWVDRFGLAGTPDQVRAKVREFIDAGIDEITIVPCIGDSKISLLKSFARDVMDKL
jgi:5,10-methylenetetrahydromethanopterin reductase